LVAAALTDGGNQDQSLVPEALRAEPTTRVGCKTVQQNQHCTATVHGCLRRASPDSRTSTKVF
jgi:hypothetical protein